MPSYQEEPGMSACPFCNVDPARVSLENRVGLAIPSAYPVTAGHTLVISKVHAASLSELPLDDQLGLWELASLVRDRLREELHPEGFNIGINDGPVAGQTVMHVHIHIIPRRQGDVADPRGGIRWIIPEKARYW